CWRKLEKYKNVQLLRLDDSTGKTDVGLNDRVKKANNWGADALVSIHQNALNAQWGSHGGTETYIAPNHSKASKEIADIVQRSLVKAMGLRDRGVKTGNFAIVRD